MINTRKLHSTNWLTIFRWANSSFIRSGSTSLSWSANLCADQASLIMSLDSMIKVCMVLNLHASKFVAELLCSSSRCRTGTTQESSSSRCRASASTSFSEKSSSARSSLTWKEVSALASLVLSSCAWEVSSSAKYQRMRLWAAFKSFSPYSREATRSLTSWDPSSKPSSYDVHILHVPQ